MLLRLAYPTVTNAFAVLRHWGDETPAAVSRINRLTTAGCAVLQLTMTKDSLHLPGTTLLHLPRPSSAPAAIAKAATDAIRKTR